MLSHFCHFVVSEARSLCSDWVNRLQMQLSACLRVPDCKEGSTNCLCGIANWMMVSLRNERYTGNLSSWFMCLPLGTRGVHNLIYAQAHLHKMMPMLGIETSRTGVRASVAWLVCCAHHVMREHGTYASTQKISDLSPHWNRTLEILQFR